MQAIVRSAGDCGTWFSWTITSSQAKHDTSVYGPSIKVVQRTPPLDVRKMGKHPMERWIMLPVVTVWWARGWGECMVNNTKLCCTHSEIRRRWEWDHGMVLLFVVWSWYSCFYFWKHECRSLLNSSGQFGATDIVTTISSWPTLFVSAGKYSMSYSRCY